MDRRAALERLKSCEPQLRDAGIEHLYLFGSVARNEGAGDSDIDLLFDVVAGQPFGLWEKAGLQQMLTEHLGRKVDFIERAGLRSFAHASAERDLVNVF